MRKRYPLPKMKLAGKDFKKMYFQKFEAFEREYDKCLQNGENESVAKTQATVHAFLSENEFKDMLEIYQLELSYKRKAKERNLQLIAVIANACIAIGLLLHILFG